MAYIWNWSQQAILLNWPIYTRDNVSHDALKLDVKSAKYLAKGPALGFSPWFLNIFFETFNFFFWHCDQVLLNSFILRSFQILNSCYMCLLILLVQQHHPKCLWGLLCLWVISLQQDPSYSPQRLQPSLHQAPVIMRSLFSAFLLLYGQQLPSYIWGKRCPSVTPLQL